MAPSGVLNRDVQVIIVWPSRSANDSLHGTVLGVDSGAKPETVILPFYWQEAAATTQPGVIGCRGFVKIPQLPNHQISTRFVKILVHMEVRVVKLLVPQMSGLT